MSRIQNDRDLLRSLRFTLKKHLPVVKYANEKVVCTPSQLFVVTAQAQFSFKVKEQSTGEKSCHWQPGWVAMPGQRRREFLADQSDIPHTVSQNIDNWKLLEKGVGGCWSAADPTWVSSVPWQPGGQTTHPGLKHRASSLEKRRFCHCLQHGRCLPMQH